MATQVLESIRVTDMELLIFTKEDSVGGKILLIALCGLSGEEDSFGL